MLLLKAYVTDLRGDPEESRDFDYDPDANLNLFYRTVRKITAAAKEQRNYYRTLVAPTSFYSFIKDLTLPFLVIWEVAKAVGSLALGLALTVISLLALVGMAAFFALILSIAAMLGTVQCLLAPSKLSLNAWFEEITKIFTRMDVIKETYWLSFLLKLFIRLPAAAIRASAVGVYAALQSFFTALYQLVTLPLYFIGKFLYKLLTLSATTRKSNGIKAFENWINPQLTVMQSFYEQHPFLNYALEKVPYYPLQNDVLKIITPVGKRIHPKKVKRNVFLLQLAEQYAFLEALGVTQLFGKEALFDLENPCSFIRLSLYHYLVHRSDNDKTRKNIALQLLLDATPHLAENCLGQRLTFHTLMSNEIIGATPSISERGLIKRLAQTMQNIHSLKEPAITEMAINFLLTCWRHKSGPINFIKQMRLLCTSNNHPTLITIARHLRKTQHWLFTTQLSPPVEIDFFTEKANGVHGWPYGQSYWLYLRALNNNPLAACLNIIEHYAFLKKHLYLHFRSLDSTFWRVCFLMNNSSFFLEASDKENTLKQIFYEIKVHWLMLFLCRPEAQSSENESLLFGKGEPLDKFYNVPIKAITDNVLPVKNGLPRHESVGTSEKFTHLDASELERGTILLRLIKGCLKQRSLWIDYFYSFINNLVAFYKSLTNSGRMAPLISKIGDHFLVTLWANVERFASDIEELEARSSMAFFKFDRLPLTSQTFFTTECSDDIENALLKAHEEETNPNKKKFDPELLREFLSAEVAEVEEVPSSKRGGAPTFQRI